MDLVVSTKSVQSGVEVRVAAVPERLDRGWVVWEWAVYVNDRLIARLGKVGVRVLDWRASIHCMGSWCDDGVHFSRKASRTVGGKVAELVKHF